MLFRNPMPNHIHELVEPAKLLELLNAVSGVLGCTVAITDQHGEPAVPTSLQGEFCSLIKSHLPVGDECQRCHADLNEQALRQGQLVRARCHLGLEFIHVPLTVDGRHLAMLGAANIAVQELDSQLLAVLAGENDLPLAMVQEKAAQVCILSDERLQAAERLIRVVAQQINDLCHQRYHLMRRLNEVSSLIEISQSINGSLGLDDLLERILDIAATVLGSVNCAVYLMGDDGKLALKTQRGLAPEAWPSVFKTGEGLIGTVAKQQKPLVVGNVDHDPRVVHLEHVRRYGMRQFLGIPLVVAGQTVGVLATVEVPVDHLDAAKEEFLMLLANQIAIAVHKAALHRELRESYFDTIRTLAAAIDAKDSYTHGHSERVCRYSVAIAEEMGLGAEALERIENAALLHDIGKISVADAILGKPGRLTSEEFGEIRNHPARGVRILEPVDTFQDFLDYVLYHHERHDGGGYPGGLHGEEIPLGARILCVADSFDAMTSGRPYQQARSFEEALAELWACAGRQFDPEVVAAFQQACSCRPELFEDSEYAGVQGQFEMDHHVQRQAVGEE